GVQGTESHPPPPPPQPQPPQPRTRGRKRKFAWRTVGFTECSRTCGGGVQSPILACVREHGQTPVPERRCAGLQRPPPQMLRCAIKPCPAQWTGGDWGACSVTCGLGVQARGLLCQQQVTPTLTMTVAAGACLGPEPSADALPRTRRCLLPACEGAGPSARAGADGDGGDPGLPPAPQPAPRPGAGSRWHAGPWSKPPVAQAFRLEGYCVGLDLMNQHVTRHLDQRNHCSARCGRGRQTRATACIAIQRGILRVVPDGSCAVLMRPEHERSCVGHDCGPDWFAAEWTTCSRDCGGGIQRRDVRCLDQHQRPSSDCSDERRPATKKTCNTHECGTSQNGNGSGTTENRLKDDPIPSRDSGDQAISTDEKSVHASCIHSEDSSYINDWYLMAKLSMMTNV
ncbi:Uncharacterized protein GBIM_15973, partial [Gryllus bimaculatus]